MAGEEICDFVWQHQYHKNWVTYSDKENEKLNKATKRRQKTVTLPSNDDKKKIVVHLDEMYHINQVSSICQPIRCLIYNDDFYSWLWKDDDGNWRSYRPHIVFFLEVAYQRKERTFKFYENADYIINFDKFIQINEKTHHPRSILREQVDIVLSSKKFNQYSKNKEFKNICLNEPLNFEKSCINFPAVPSTVCSLSYELKPSNTPNTSLTLVKNDIVDKSSSNLKLTLKQSDELCDFVWQHQYHKNWVSYSDKENAILNKAVKKRQKTVTLPSKDDKKKIVVHLDEMYHINQVSSINQPIRCLIYNDDFYSWIWKDDDENWHSYRPHIVFFLEVAYQRNEKTFKFYENADYIINFDKFIEINEKTSHSRCILREKVDIELSLKKLNQTLINEEFEKMCLNESLNFEKRCINLPALSSTVCSMTLELPPSNILNDSLRVLENEIAEQCDIKRYECNLPPDAECPNRDNFHIYCEEGSAFSATLSLANVLNNINKYYILQLLKHNKKNQYFLFQRLGRVGTKGRHEFICYESCIFHAKADFEAKFFEKTKNRWCRNKFVHFQGKYDLLDVDLSPESKKNDVAASLDTSIESFLVMICDRKAMVEILKEMSYDSSNTPLGKLTSKQIKHGYMALNKIVQITSQDYTGCALVNACDEFYTKIPHNFGKKCLPLIRTVDDIKEKLGMLEALSNIRIATKTMNAKSDAIEHPLNKYYKSLMFALEPLNSSRIEYSAVVKYLKHSHGPTHTNYDMEIIDVFKCHPKDESSLKRNNNKILLWHGSRITNWSGILKRGLCIAPPEAPHIGCMFGKGLYFADVSSKSANYCFATKKKNKGVLLLCEVDVGKQLHLTVADENLPKSLPASYNSVLGKGKFTPIGYQYGSLSKTAKEPIFQLVEDTHLETCLNYNEYVVYNSDLVEMKYLLVIQFNFKEIL